MLFVFEIHITVQRQFGGIVYNKPEIGVFGKADIPLIASGICGIDSDIGVVSIFDFRRYLSDKSYIVQTVFNLVWNIAIDRCEYASCNVIVSMSLGVVKQSAVIGLVSDYTVFKNKCK